MRIIIIKIFPKHQSNAYFLLSTVRSHKYGRKRQDGNDDEDDDYVYDAEYTAYRAAADRYNETDSDDDDDDYEDGSDSDDDDDDESDEEEDDDKEDEAKAGTSADKGGK